MTYNPKKGDIVNIYENGAYGSVPMYVVTGETKTMYKCVTPNGAVVYKEAREMFPSDDDDDRLTFMIGAQTALNNHCDKEKQFRALLELAQSEQQ